MKSTANKTESRAVSLKDQLPATDLPVMNRRKFFKWLGGGLAIAVILPDVLLASPEKAIAGKIPVGQIGAWLHISEAGTVTVFTGKVEVGQNIRTSLAQVVAEELRVPVASIKMVMGDTDLVPYDAGTFGSRSTPTMGSQLRKAAIAAREVILEEAAKQLKVDKKLLQLANGKVTDPANQKSWSYGQLLTGKQLLQTIPEDLPATPVSQWKIAGTSVPKVNGRDFLTGKHKYVSDLKLPGMVYGKILRAPSYGATLAALDVSQAKAIAGVTVVREGDFVGVTAPDAATARKAIAAIKAEWKTKAQPSRSEIFTYLKKQASPGQEGGRNAGTNQGELAQGLAAADKTLKATYTVDYVAHAPMEPRAALAQWEKDKLTVWTGTQRPFGVQSDLVEEFKAAKSFLRPIVVLPNLSKSPLISVKLCTQVRIGLSSTFPRNLPITPATENNKSETWVTALVFLTAFLK